jgi:hypothetical protein
MKVGGLLGCQPYAPAAFTPRPRSVTGTDFCLEYDPTPGPYFGRKDYVDGELH